jgi:hypothetical protein
MRGQLVAVVLVVAGCSGDAKTTTSSHAPPSSDPRALVLTAGDLARGFEYGDDTVGEGPDASEGDLRTLQALFAEEAPTACIIELQWVWKGDPPYSRGVTRPRTSSAMTTTLGAPSPIETSLLPTPRRCASENGSPSISATRRSCSGAAGSTTPARAVDV